MWRSKANGVASRRSKCILLLYTKYMLTVSSSPLLGVRTRRADPSVGTTVSTFHEVLQG